MTLWHCLLLRIQTFPGAHHGAGAVHRYGLRRLQGRSECSHNAGSSGVQSGNNVMNDRATIVSQALLTTVMEECQVVMIQPC